MNFLNKLLGNKSGRDMKVLNPRVPEILAQYDTLQSLTNDQLRAKTAEFRQKIAHELADLDSEKARIHSEIESKPDMDPAEKDVLFRELDDLKKKRNEKQKKVLD